MSATTIECTDCSDTGLVTCPDCHGTSWHWCRLDDAASWSRDNSAFCGQPNGAPVAAPDCDTCENAGRLLCGCAES